MQQCTEFSVHLSYKEVTRSAMTATLFFNCILNLAFISLIFTLRKIDDKFNMNWELQRVTFFKIVCDSCWVFSLLFLTETWFVVYGFFEYFDVLLCISILYISVIEPIRGTYKANEIIPFPLNEQVIRSAESSMAHKISSRYFYDFLCRDLKDLKSLSIFALYSDLKRY
jgi:Sodium:neurotransmitter symporter family